MPADANVFYWGCWGSPGHEMFSPRGSIDSRSCDGMGLPRFSAMDGGALFLPQPEIVGNAALTYLPAPRLTILAWWGNPWDRRGAVNSAIICRGMLSEDECWSRFEQKFPQLAKALNRPRVVTLDVVRVQTVKE